MQYLLYFIVCFKVQGIIREMFMVDVMDVALANREVFTQWHTHDAEVASMQYKKANGTPSPFSSDTTLLEF
jgi:hypothetical protein